METEGDNSFIARARLGDAAALTRLLVDSEPALRRHAEMLVSNSGHPGISSDDVVQETLRSAFLGVATFDARVPGGFAAWLRVIANARHTDMVRAAAAKKRGGGEANAADQLSDDSVAAVLTVIAADSHTPSRSTARREDLRSLRTVLDKTPAADVRLLTLRYDRRMEWDLVAQALGCSAGAARERHQRILDRLRKELLGPRTTG